MAKRQWTLEQEKAIRARGGSLLVSAAAGSGKTAVLVQRVIERISSTENPCNINELLIVTFTKAAASEMRERISRALSELLMKEPQNRHLARQQILLAGADICTIDKFCNKLVRENFSVLGVSPSYKVAEGGDALIMRSEAMAAVLEEFYRENSPAFKNLFDLFIKGNNDSPLSDAILSLYEFSRAYPFPEDWLRNSAALYDEDLPFSESIWGKILIDFTKSLLAYAKEISESSLKTLEEDDALYAAYSEALKADSLMFASLLSICTGSSWDKLCTAINSIAFTNIGRAPRGYDSPLKSRVQARRKYVKELVDKKLLPVFSISESEHREDMEYLKPALNKLIEMSLVFSERFLELKKKRDMLDFSDIEHMALSLLVEKSEKGLTKTAFANEISDKYAEILVDEYQDINESQNMLFEALSKNRTNLFTVGDVKQSIYRFRKAMPEIFLRQRDSRPFYDKDNYPAKITLGKNFRSRKGIAGIVNFTFSRLMSREVGELEYDENEKLIYGASYEDKDAAESEFHILNLGEKDEDESKDVFEARYISSLIKSMMASDMTVNDKGTERPLKYRDFCILLRSLSSKVTSYIQQLSDNNIPCFSEVGSGFFEAKEIKTMLSFLRVIDNPLQDIPLLALMMSPFYGFTPDDISDIRLPDLQKGGSIPLYSSVVSAKDINPLCEKLLADLQLFRQLSATLPAGETIRRIYDETGYLSLAQAMKNGSQRKQNLYLLLDYANRYDDFGTPGLSGFIRFIDRLQEQNADLAPAGGFSESADVVRIMTIHKSKGLEFPVCILAGCSGKFNSDTSKGKIIISPDLGAAMMRRDNHSLSEFKTLPFIAASAALKKSEMSEELRLLYVAMTRAKERFISIISDKNPENRLISLSASYSDSEKATPFSVLSANSFSDWLLSVLMRHPSGGDLRKMAGINQKITAAITAPAKIVFAGIENSADSSVESAKVAPPCEALIKQIEERLSYTYPFAALSNIMAKRTASNIEENYISRVFFASKKPSFLYTQGLTPAQVGTAAHKFMQFCSIKNARENLDKEIERLTLISKLSSAEAAVLDRKRLRAFAESRLAERMLTSDNLMREKRFAVNLPASYFDSSLAAEFWDEKIFVQGIADCVFEEKDGLVVVDYKTDRTENLNTLIENYRAQLEIYRLAMEECLGLKVKETILYSLHQMQEIVLK